MKKSKNLKRRKLIIFKRNFESNVVMFLFMLYPKICCLCHSNEHKF